MKIIASCGNDCAACLRYTKEPICKKVCTNEEYEQIRKAFFEKEENLELVKG